MPHNIIASTKLTIPRPGRALISRPGLIERMNEPSWRLGVVSAPAGFGKTSLLSEWAVGRADSCAWYSCDPTDAEPVRFWTGVIAALAERWPGVGDDAIMALNRTGAEDLGAVVSLANDLTDVSAGPTLVIDDLHFAQPAPAVLAAFANALPSHMRLAIGSRVQPALPLARRRVHGDLLELHRPDLAFSPDESAAVLANFDTELDPAELMRLGELTEGWPAAIQLAAVSLRWSRGGAEFLTALAATDGPMADYLVNELLAGLPGEWVDFMLRTSVLDEFDVELCAHMTHCADAASIVADLVAADLFVIPLGQTGGWFRYHHLLSSYLRARLRSQGSDRLRDANDAAADLLEARGLVVPAMRHALANNDGERAASIGRRSLNESMYPADVDMTAAAARLWLHERGRDMLATDPMLALEVIVSLAATSDSDDVARWLQLVSDTHPHPTNELKTIVLGTWADHHLGRGQIAQAVRSIDEAMLVYDGVLPNTGLFPLLYGVHIRSHLAAGSVAAARASLERIAAHPTGHAPLDEVRLPGHRASLAVLDGDLRRALTLGEECLRRADDLGLGVNDAGRVTAGLVIAAVHSERGNDVAASAALAGAVESAALGGRTWFRCAVLLHRAAHARVAGDADAAENDLTLARLMMTDPSPEIQTTFATEAARQALRFRPWTAAPLLQALPDTIETVALRVQLALEHDEIRPAERDLDRLRTPATSREVAEFGMLLALAAPDLHVAVQHLGPALAVAEREGFVRTILGAGTRVPQLLAALPAGVVAPAYVEMLLNTSESSGPSARLGNAERMIDPLTDREIDILRYLSSRLTNPEIAAVLYISRNTLKSHVKAVYRKLEVSSRAEAVKAGRARRLI